MNLTTFIDIAIGLTLMYLGASLFVTILNEFVAQLFTLRGKQLADGLAKIIDNPETRQALSGLPTLAPLFEKKGNVPSYVDPALFANALLGTFGAVEAGVSTVDELATAIAKLPECSMRTQLLALARSASGGVHGFVQSVGTWVDTSLTMLGGSYKRRARTLSLAFGLLAAGLFNLDTFSVASHLNRDAAARQSLAAAGSQFVEKMDATKLNECLAGDQAAKGEDCKVVRELATAITSRDSKLGALPIGWAKPEDVWIAPGPFMTRLLGWILTALAISLGAPFWFDFLSKLVSVRNGMAKPKVETK